SWDGRARTPLSLAGIVDGALIDDRGDSANRVVVPGDAAHSQLLQRMTGNAGPRMPPVATRERDLAGEQLIEDWIVSLAVPRPPASVLNLSARAETGAGANVLVPSFVIAGTEPKTVLVRAIGPTLATMQVSAPLSDPVLTLFSGASSIFANAGWNTATNAGEIRATAARVGAFPLPDGSADSALLVTLAPGPYTAHASSSAGSSGTALVEVYDADPAPGGGSSRLVNVAVRAALGGSSEIIIPGIVVGSGAAPTMLLRAVGPGLGAYGVSNPLPRPMLTLYAGSEPYLTNQGWGAAANAAEISATAVAVGAFPFASGSADAAILTRLDPGAYTLHVASADGSAGIVLVEVYEAP
ncbi:MAG: hypothetical protein ACREIA_27275, partial [Opitutaceae bacterium]